MMGGCSPSDGSGAIGHRASDVQMVKSQHVPVMCKATMMTLSVSCGKTCGDRGVARVGALVAEPVCTLFLCQGRLITWGSTLPKASDCEFIGMAQYGTAGTLQSPSYFGALITMQKQLPGLSWA